MGGMDGGKPPNDPPSDRNGRLGDPAYRVPTRPYWQEDVTDDNESWSWWELCPWYWWLCIIFVVAGAIWLVTA